MGLDDIINKGKEFLKGDKLEEVSDTVLDAAEGAANKATGGKFEGQVGGVRDAADGAIGS